MKSMVGRFATVLIVAAILTPFSPCLAQASGPISVTVPFNFVVRDQVMPAGDYTLKHVSTSGTPFWEMRTGKVAVLFGAQVPTDNKESYPPRLTFYCYADDCFLSEIHAIGDWKLLESRLQRGIAKNVRRDTREVVLR